MLGRGAGTTRKIAFNQAADFLAKTANSIYLVIFLYIYVRVILNLQRIIPASTTRYVGMCLLWLLTLICGVVFAKLLLKEKQRKNILLIVVIILQFVYVWSVHSQTGADAYVLTYIAYHLAQGDIAALDGFWKEYLAVYTNNIPATSLLTGIFTVWLPDTLEQAWLFMSLIAAALSDLALFFIYKLVKYLLNETMAILALILSIPLISMSEPSTILYTDIMVLWTTPAALYLIVRGMREQKGWLYIGATGSVLAFGAWIKTQSMIVTIAVGIVLILVMMRCQEKAEVKTAVMQAVAVISSFVLVLVCLSFISGLMVDLLGEDYVEQNEMPMLHFVSMGLNPETNGAYDEEDVVDMKTTLGQEAKRQVCLEKISARMDQLGLCGLAEHIDEKLIFGVGRGTFTSAREWRGTLLNDAKQAVRIQNWTVICNSGFDNVTAVWIQSGYLIMMGVCSYSALDAVFGKRKERDQTKWFVTNVCRISMIGIVMMLVFLERNLRYMYSMLPCMIVLTVYSVDKIKQMFIDSGND